MGGLAAKVWALAVMPLAARVTRARIFIRLAKPGRGMVRMLLEYPFHQYGGFLETIRCLFDGLIYI
jgi:hypothetical protein